MLNIFMSHTSLNFFVLSFVLAWAYPCVTRLSTRLKYTLTTLALANFCRSLVIEHCTSIEEA